MMHPKLRTNARRGRACLIGWAVAALLPAALPPGVGAQITIDPESIDLSLAPGEEYIETKTVMIPGGSPGTPVDIYFLADTTGSMGPVLDQVQADAEDILEYLSTFLSDARFGLGEYKDFPRDDFAFQNDVSMTTDIDVMLAAIDVLAHGGGGDGAEGQFFALDQISDASDPSGIGFRTDVQKIIVWFGDAPGHDPMCSAISGLDYDITQDSVIAKLVENEFTVVAIGTTTGFMYALNDDPRGEERYYRDYDGICEIGGESGQADAITAATGGMTMQDVDPEGIADAIIAAIEFAISTVTVELVPSGDIIPYTDVLTPPYTEAALPLDPDDFLTLEFQVKFTGHDCDPNLVTHIFVGAIDAVVNDAVGASQDVTLRQPSCDNQPPECDAGGPYAVECQEGTTSIQLDGSASYDPPLDDIITHSWWADCLDASFDDDASATPTLTLDSDGACTSTCTVHLTVTDRHGVATNCQVDVEVTDATQPQFDTFPVDTTVECGDSTDPAGTGEPTGSDACGDVTITYSDATVAGCGDTLTITRTWRIEDTCGNSVEQDQLITVEDTADPQFDTFPPDQTVECADSTDPADTGEPSGSDACGGVVITYADASVAGCGSTETITRTWRVEDACGNFLERDQIITVLDTTNPQFDTFPSDQTIECTNPTDPANTGQPTGSDVCGNVTVTHTDATVAGCGNTETITRTWRIEDACGRFTEQDQIVTVVDTTAPQFDTFPLDATVECPGSIEPADLGEPTGSDTCGEVTIGYTDSVVGNCGITETITRSWRVTDACGNSSEQDQLIDVVDTTAPLITCPPEITIKCNEPSDPAHTGWATATDACDADPLITYQDDVDVQPCWWEGVVTRTWTATDHCGNSDSCTQTITVVDPRIPRALAGGHLIGAGSDSATMLYDIPDAPPPEKGPGGDPGDPRLQKLAVRSDLDRVSTSEKGSLLVYPKVELRWNLAGELLQDTFITINNDFGAEVTLQMYFVGETCVDVDNVITLSEYEPAYWSVATGLPKGVSPFPVLGEGYPDPEGTGDLILRGYVVAWAINEDYAQIRWNHLSGGATIVHYYGGTWEYDAYAFRALSVGNGEPVGTPGVIELDGDEYSLAFEKLLLEFFASGSSALSGAERSLTHDTDLALLIVSNDFRRDGPGPDTTKVVFEIFNENEVLFSSMEYCITKWDDSLLSSRGGHFLLESLQTDRGHTRISGVASDVCPNSTKQALLGVAVNIMTFD